VSQPEDEDDEPEDEDDEPEDDGDEEWAVDELLGRKVVSDEDFKQDCRFEPGTVLYLVAWEGCGDDENTWEPCKHISNDLIRDYYDSTSGRSWRARLPMRRVSQRMMMATTSLWKWTSKRRRSSRFYLCGLSSTSIIYNYYDPTGNGGLFCVWVKLKYSDGSTTPGYVSSTFLGDSEEGLALLRAYTKRKVGQSALKYMPWV
jgi:hypothetical protein